MTVAVTQLLEHFDALPPGDRELAAQQLLPRILKTLPDELSDEALVAAAEELFLELDAREAADASA